MATPLNKAQITKLMEAWKAERTLIKVMAMTKCFGNEANAEDLMQQTLIRQLEGDQPWAAANVPFITHIRRVMQNLRSKARKKAETRRVVPMLPDAERDNVKGPHENPEQVLTSGLTDQMFDEVCAELTEGSVARECMELARRDITDPQGQAEALRVDVTRVYKAREKLREKIEIVLARYGRALPKKKASGDGQ